MAIFFAIFSTVCFGLAAVFLSLRYERAKKELEAKQKELSRQLYELSILRSVQEKIGYSLSPKDIAETIATTAGNMFRLTSISYAIIDNKNIVLKTFLKEAVGDNFSKGVKNIVLSALYGIDESVKGLAIDEKVVKNDALLNNGVLFDGVPLSYFNIPLVLNNKLAGIITIASKDAHVYQDEDMSMLYKIVNQTQLAIGRLQTVIDTEKGKIDSLISSLRSGAMLFLLEEGKFRLMTINNAARNFLRLKGEADTYEVLAAFGAKPSLITEIKEIVELRKSTFHRNLEIYGNHFNVYLTPVLSHATEAIIGVSLTMQDITVEKELEKLRESFTSMVVHELRAPLTAIKSASSMMLETELSDEDRKKMNTVIFDSTERLLQDVSELLDAAKVDAGKYELKLSKGSIENAIDNSIKTLTYLAKNKSISLVNDLKVPIPFFDFDSLRIEEVLNNLISNAIKYSHEGGSITISAKPTENYLQLEVKDTGVGIPTSKLSMLFSQFNQADSMRRGEGTGLGLYIAKVIVESHNGKIWIESKEGLGTSVFFTLPMINAQEMTQKSAIVPERVLN